MKFVYGLADLLDHKYLIRLLQSSLQESGGTAKGTL
jgi:hypothetical protein